MPRIFINYRRTDSSPESTELYENFAKAFKTSSVFLDTLSIAPGSDFTKLLGREASERDVMISVIGPSWIDDPKCPTNSRIHDADDYVRAEIEAALANGLLVVPVLVRGASMPSKGELPISLRGLTQRNAFRLSNGATDIDNLIKILKGRGFAHRGNTILLAVFGSFLALDATLVAANTIRGREVDAPAVVGFGLVAALIAGVYCGVEWARRLMIVLCVVGILFYVILFTLLVVFADSWAPEFGHLFALVTLLVAIGYVATIFYCLNYSPSVRVFLESQRSRFFYARSRSETFFLEPHVSSCVEVATDYNATPPSNEVTSEKRAVEIVKCPHCFVRVAIMEDSVCPSCSKKI